jgi:threonine synthase
MSLRISAASRLVCGGCGAAPKPEDPYPFRCPNAGDGGDHVLRRLLDPALVEFPVNDPEPNPFVRYRVLLHTYHLARSYGMDDETFVALVRRLDEKIGRVEGHGFSATPFRPAPALARRIGLAGSLWVKDETGDVSGSHKARHLFGLLLHLEVVEQLGLVRKAPRADLAIASCGNAARAAAVLAAAGGRRLRVFVPSGADPVLVAQLRQLDAEVRVCTRAPGLPGDPSYRALREAIADGALPFTCQGNENGLTIEGAETIGYEMVGELVAAGTSLDAVVVQVGGGALASAVAAAFADAVALGVLPHAPRLHTVQTEAAWPLKRAYDLVAKRLPKDAGVGALQAVLHDAARRRACFMWPWEKEPQSIAHGIIDDETYDWLAVVEAMLTTGGHPVTVGEEALAFANGISVKDTGICVDETGSAGVAGLIELRRLGLIAANARVAVVFTGARR